MKDISIKQFEEFISLTSQLSPPELIGVARMLLVEVLLDEKDDNGHRLPKNFEDIYEGILDAFLDKGRKERKEIIRLLRAAAKENAEAKLRSVQEQDAAEVINDGDDSEHLA